MAKGKQRRATPAERADREEQKRARREERKRREEAERRRKRRRRRLRAWGLGGLAVVVVGAGIAYLVWPDPEVEGVERPRSQGSEHVQTGTPLDYDDAAPTSGDHYAAAADCGAYSDRPDLPLVVHALEHGTVVLWYDPDVEDEARPRLLEVMEEYDSHVIVAPNPEIDEPVVATAWNRRMRFADIDDPAIDEFADVYRNRGPESVDCPIG